MFLPEIYMYLQRIPAAPRQAPSVAPRAAIREPDGDAPARAAADPRPAATPARASAVPPPASPAPPANEWDEWKSVRDVA